MKAVFGPPFFFAQGLVVKASHVMDSDAIFDIAAEFLFTEICPTA